MSAAMWSLVSLVAFIGAGIVFVIALVLFFRLNIVGVMGIVSGKTASREIERVWAEERQKMDDAGDVDFFNHMQNAEITSSRLRTMPKDQSAQVARVNAAANASGVRPQPAEPQTDNARTTVLDQSKTKDSREAEAAALADSRAQAYNFDPKTGEPVLGHTRYKNRVAPSTVDSVAVAAAASGAAPATTNVTRSEQPAPPESNEENDLNTTLLSAEPDIDDDDLATTLLACDDDLVTTMLTDDEDPSGLSAAEEDEYEDDWITTELSAPEVSGDSLQGTSSQATTQEETFALTREEYFIHTDEVLD